MLVPRGARRLPIVGDPRRQADRRCVELLRKRSATRVKILVTGSAGFIAGYLVEELLANGYEVVGLDNYSKYGPVERAFEKNPAYAGVEGDAKDVALLKDLLADCDQL